MAPWIRWLLVAPAAALTMFVANRVLDLFQGPIVAVIGSLSAGNPKTGVMAFSLLALAAPSVVAVYVGGRTAPSLHQRTGQVLAVLLTLFNGAVTMLLWMADGELNTLIVGTIGVVTGAAFMHMACGELHTYESRLTSKDKRTGP